VAEAQLLTRYDGSARPRTNPGLQGPAWRRPGNGGRTAAPDRTGPGVRASILIAMTLVAWAASAAGGAGAQTCLRPKWTECVLFPDGGRHTGISPAGKPLGRDVPPGAKICVSTEWEIRAENYVLFEHDGHPWPDRDWEVEAETFCFYRN
jgi:hypothetical protein